MTKYILVLILGSFFSFTLIAHANDSQATLSWAKFKYPGCDTFHMLAARPIYFHSIPRAALEKCTALPEMTKACFASLDAVLGPKLDTQAKNQGCDVAKAALQAAASDEPETPANEPNRMSIVCESTSFMGPTSASTSSGTKHFCRRRTECSRDFAFYGKTYESGFYEISCPVNPGFICSNIHAYENEPCDGASIRELGLFDKVKNFIGVD